MEEKEIRSQLRELNHQADEQPDNPELYNNLGVGHYLLGEYEVSIGYLQKAIHLKSDPSYLFNLANSYAESGNPEKGIEIYLKVLDSNPDHIGALNNLADTYETVGEYKRAHELFTYITQIQPDEALSHFNLGNFFLRQNQHIEAAKCYETAIERDEIFVDAYYNIAWILYRAKALEESKKYIKKGLKIDPYNEDLNELLEKIRNH